MHYVLESCMKLFDTFANQIDEEKKKKKEKGM